MGGWPAVTVELSADWRSLRTGRPREGVVRHPRCTVLCSRLKRARKAHRGSSQPVIRPGRMPYPGPPKDAEVGGPGVWLQMKGTCLRCWSPRYARC